MTLVAEKPAKRLSPAMRRRKEDHDRFMRLMTPNDGQIAPQTPRPASVRVAQELDEQRVFDLFMMAADENALSPVNEAKVHEGIGNAIHRRGAVIGVIDGENGVLAGAVGIMMTPFWYSSEWACQEMLNFVHPDYRQASTNHAADLIQFAKWWSEQLGTALIMGVLSPHRAEGKVRLYRRSLSFVGALFMHRGGSR